MRRALPFALLLCVLAVPTARANGRFPQSNEIAFSPSDPLTIYARTTFGILVTHDGGTSWRWICESSLGFRPTEDPPLGITADGHILMSLFVGQKVGTPDGCQFDFAATELTHEYAIDNAVDPSNAHRAYVITSQGGAVPMNQPWRTDDDGAHWMPLGTPITDVLFETIDVAKSDPMRVYMTGALPPTSTARRMPFVYHSTDGGVDFDVYPYTLGPTDQNIFIAGVDPTNAARLYVRVAGDQSTTPISPDRLMISTDGGMTFTDAIDLANMYGFAQSDDGQTVWVGSPAMGLFRSDDRGDHFTNVNPDLQVNCLAARGTELWACGNDFADFFVVGKSHDGGMSFDPEVRLKSIAGPVMCPASSTAGICTCQWCGLATMFDPTVDCTTPTDFCAMIDGGLPPTLDAGPMTVDGGPVPVDGGTTGSEPPPPPSGGCCAVAGARQGVGALTVAAVFVAAGWRRRRPRR